MLNWIVRKRTVWSFTCVPLKSVSHIIYLIYVSKQALASNYAQQLIWHKKQTKLNQVFEVYSCN